MTNDEWLRYWERMLKTMTRVLEKKYPGLLEDLSELSEWYNAPERASFQEREKRLWDETDVLLKERKDFEKFKRKVVEWMRLVLEIFETYWKEKEGA